MSQEPVTTYCPTCGKAFRIPADLLGKRVACKACQTHFIVQADKPGIPAPQAAAHGTAVAAGAPHAAPAPTPHAKPAPGGPPASAAPAARAATAKAPAAPPSNPPVTAATAAPIPTPHAIDELAPIPFDDAPIALSADGSSQVSMPMVAKPQANERVKVEAKGRYFVVKLVTHGQMAHVTIEKTLNQYAEDGWELVQVVPIGSEAYAILNRDPPPEKPAEPAATDS